MSGGLGSRTTAPAVAVEIAGIVRDSLRAQGWIDGKEADELRAAGVRAEQREAKWLKGFLDAEKFDAKHGVRLPGDSALAVMLNSAEEMLARLAGVDKPA